MCVHVYVADTQKWTQSWFENTKRDFGTDSEALLKPVEDS